MSRRVGFSSGHRFWLAGKSEEENGRLFGRWASPYNHGHNYVLEVQVTGEVDPRTGMIVNIKDIDGVLQRDIVTQFDQRSINDEIPAFADQSPSLENILGYIRSQLTGLPAEVKLRGLRLEETPLLHAEWTADRPRMISITRVYEFAASHRLHVAGMSGEQNIQLFGKCNNLHGHGHNYLLEVTVEGEPDESTGMIVDIDKLDSIVHERVVDRYDHKNLSMDVPEFADKNPTSEVVALEIFEALKSAVPARLARVRLHETARNIFEVNAS